MKIIGGVILLFVALAVSRGYRSFVSDGVKQAQGFLDLFVGLKTHIRGSGAPIESYMLGVDIPSLSAVGFFAEYERRKSLSDAFLSVRQGLFVPNGMLDAVGRVLDLLGRGDISTEVGILDDGIDELKKMIEEYRSASERSVRVVTVTLAAVSFGLFVILL